MGFSLCVTVRSCYIACTVLGESCATLGQHHACNLLTKENALLGRLNPVFHPMLSSVGDRSDSGLQDSL